MNSEISGETLSRLGERLRRWAAQLEAWHLAAVADALLDSGSPLGVIGAQVLWVAQPVLGLWLPRDEIAALAHLIDSPEGLAWVHEHFSDGSNGSDGTVGEAPRTLGKTSSKISGEDGI